MYLKISQEEEERYVAIIEQIRITSCPFSQLRSYKMCYRVFFQTKKLNPFLNIETRSLVREKIAVGCGRHADIFDVRICSTALFLSFLLAIRFIPPGRGVVLFAAFFFLSRAKLIDRRCDYRPKNGAPYWKRVKKIC